MSGTVAGAGARRSVRGGLRHVSMRYAPVDGAPSEQRALDGRLGGELPLSGLLDLVVAGRVSYERLAGDHIAGAPERMSAGVTLRRVLRPGAGIGIEPVLGFDVADGETALSPEIGAWYRPDERFRLYGRLGRAYRVPTFADLHFEAAPGVRASPALESERVVLDAELGAEASVSPGSTTSVSARLALWSRDTRRPIVWLASSAALWSPRNLERLSARGLDLELGVERGPEGGPGGGPALGWAVEAGLTLQRSRLGFGTNRNPLPYQPDVAARASAEVRRGSTAGRLQATWTGSRTTSVAATRRLDGFLKIDVGLRQRLTPGPLDLEVTVGVENLLDRRYQLVELFPEPGRALRLTLDIR